METLRRFIQSPKQELAFKALDAIDPKSFFTENEGFIIDRNDDGNFWFKQPLPDGKYRSVDLSLTYPRNPKRLPGLLITSFIAPNGIIYASNIQEGDFKQRRITIDPNGRRVGSVTLPSDLSNDEFHEISQVVQQGITVFDVAIKEGKVKDPEFKGKIFDVARSWAFAGDIFVDLPAIKKLNESGTVRYAHNSDSHNYVKWVLSRPFTIKRED